MSPIKYVNVFIGVVVECSPWGRPGCGHGHQSDT